MRANRQWMKLLAVMLLGIAAGGWVDPGGDCLVPPERDPFDLIAVTTSFEANELVITLLLDPHIGPSIWELSGFIDLDVDRNRATGRPSHIEEFAPPPWLGMGVDYYVQLDMANLQAPARLFYVRPDGHEIVVTDSLPLAVTGSSVSVFLPRCNSSPEDGVCVGAVYATAVLIGNSSEPTDRAPNGTSPFVTVAAQADFDVDGDVDGDDLAHLIDCTTSPAIVSSLPGCDNADLDGDQDVDQSDFGLFQRCYSGEGYSSDPGCAL